MAATDFFFSNFLQIDHSKAWLAAQMVIIRNNLLIKPFK